MDQFTYVLLLPIEGSCGNGTLKNSLRTFVRTGYVYNRKGDSLESQTFNSSKCELGGKDSYLQKNRNFFRINQSNLSDLSF